MRFSFYGLFTSLLTVTLSLPSRWFMRELELDSKTGAVLAVNPNPPKDGLGGQKLSLKCSNLFG